MCNRDIVANINYAYNYAGFNKHEELAAYLKVGRPAATRYLSGERNMPDALLRILATRINVDKEDFLLNSMDFKSLIQSRMLKLPVLSFSAVSLNKSKWNEVFDRIKGQYKVYYGRIEDDKILVSLLCFEKVTSNGIEISFYNPYRDINNNYQCYEYRGIAYPVNEMIYIFAEQKNPNDYEVLSIILSPHRTPVLEFLDGIIMGVGVKKGGKSMIAANSFVCHRQKRYIDDPTKEIGKSLGYVERKDLPAFAYANQHQTIII